MQDDISVSVFGGFRQVLRKGTLVFAIIIAALCVMISYQHERSADAIRAVRHTREVIAYINQLRTYLLNIDEAARKYGETLNPADLDADLICHRSRCPSANRLVAMVRADGIQTGHLTALPALQAALETGFDALQQRAGKADGAMPAQADLGKFDKSAMEQIQRILIGTEKDELNNLETREAARIRDQTLSSVLLGGAGLWTGLVLLGLYRETRRLIDAGIQAEQTIRQLSLRDPLTGLANRRFLQENERHLLAHARRSGAQLGVLVVDLDDFKTVNDRYGHAAGDEVLLASAARMKQLLRESDVIARFGGDEFVIVLGQVEGAEAAREIANRVVSRICQPIPLTGGAVARIGASVGIAMCCAPGEVLGDLIKKADDALYAAKREGKNTFREAAPSAPARRGMPHMMESRGMRTT